MDDAHISYMWFTFQDRYGVQKLKNVADKSYFTNRYVFFMLTEQVSYVTSIKGEYVSSF